MMKHILKTGLNYLGYDVVRVKPRTPPSDIAALAVQNLRQLRDILSRHHVSYWLTSGTLLGAIREGAFIKHDVDADIAILKSSFKKECFFEISAKFNVVSKLGYPDECLELTIEKNGMTIDLFLVYADEVSMWHSVFADFKPGSYRRADYVYPKMGTSDIKFLGVDFKIPERPEEYLTCNYGSDWSIPVRNWNYFESPPNLRVAIDRINESEAARRFDHWLNE